MTIIRIVLFAASVAGSWLAGRFCASLVWDFIYSIGSRVIEDDIYYQLHDKVAGWGGVAGVSFALAIALLLRRPALGVLAAGHALATVAGFFGGSVDWRIGLWAYFNALAAFVICVAFRALFRFISHREYAHTAA